MSDKLTVFFILASCAIAVAVEAYAYFGPFQ